MDNFYCLMRTGKQLTPDVCDRLFNTAREMFASEKSRYKVKAQDCEGVISTQGDRASLGGISGVVFDAELEVESGKTQIRFVVATGDLPKGVELAWYQANIDGSWSRLDQIWN